MSSELMKPLDAVWLMMESDETPMHVGVLAVFEKPARAPADYLSKWAARMREAKYPVEPWSQCLARGAGSGLYPRLVEDQDFDIDYHFRHLALPEPGGERELGVMVSRLHSNALDRTRPLWEFHLIEGLAGGRFAFYIKVHHALLDNVNGVPMVFSLLSSDASQRDEPAPWTIPLSSGEPDEGDRLEQADPSDPLEALGAVSRVASGFLRSAFNRGSEGSFLMPRGVPRSTLNRHIDFQRRVATQRIDQARIQRLADATDSTLNEILGYLCSSSLRRFFKEYNALPDESLVAALPVSLSERSESLPGNAIAGLRVSLGTNVGDPLARLEAIKASLAEVREDRASLPEDAVTTYVMMRAAPIYASQLRGLGRFVPPLFNLGISNTPGPDQAQYYNGARLHAIYPIGQLMQFSALSIGCVSYDGMLNIGFTGARDTLPHLQRMAVYLGKAVDDLEELLEEGEDAA